MDMKGRSLQAPRRVHRSPHALVIYESGIHSHVENRCQVASIFVDHITWIANGGSVADIARELE